MFSKKLRTKLSMNGVLVRIRRQKNSTWIPAKLVSLPSIQPGQNWANLKSQNYKNISDLSIGFASITSEFHIYLLRLFGQTEFFKISFTSSSEPPDLLGRAAEISDLLKARNWILRNNRFFRLWGALRDPSVDEWLWSRRDGAIVAWHESAWDRATQRAVP